MKKTLIFAALGMCLATPAMADYAFGYGKQCPTEGRFAFVTGVSGEQKNEFSLFLPDNNESREWRSFSTDDVRHDQRAAMHGALVARAPVLIAAPRNGEDILVIMWGSDGGAVCWGFPGDFDDDNGG